MHKEIRQAILESSCIPVPTISGEERIVSQYLKLISFNLVYIVSIWRLSAEERILSLSRMGLTDPESSVIGPSPSSINTDFLTRPLRSLAAVFLPEYLLEILSLASRTSRAISDGIPASTASPTPVIELGSLQRMSSASSIRRILLASEIFSLLRESPRRPLNGETS